MINFLRSIRDREEGQTLTEYALILSLVSVASIAFLTPLSDAINGVFTSVTGALKSRASSMDFRRRSTEFFLPVRRAARNPNQLFRSTTNNKLLEPSPE